MPKMTLKSSASIGMSTATRSTRYSSHVGTMTQTTSVFIARGGGRSFGVTGQRSVNPWGNKQGTIGMREALNSAPPLILKDLQGPQCNHNHDNKMSTFEQIAMYTSLATMAAQTIAGIVNMFTDNKAAGAAKSARAAGAADLLTTSLPVNNDLKMTKTLNNANTFGEINTIENKANEKLDTFQTDYSATAQRTINGINDGLTNVKDGLDLAGVSFDTSKLAASTLNIDPNDLATFDKGIETIDKDIEKADKFVKDITSGIASIDDKAAKITEEIRSLDIQINKLKQVKSTNADGTPNPEYAKVQTQIKEYETKKAELEEQKTKLKKAKEELKTIKDNDIAELKNALTDKKSELQDIKQVKSQLEDKKSQLAKKQDKEIDNYKGKMNKIAKDIEKTDKEIKELQTKLENANDSDKAKLQGKLKNLQDNRADKVISYNNFVPSMQSFQKSITDMGDDMKKYKLNNKSIASKYTTKYDTTGNAGTTEATTGSSKNT